MNLSVLLSRIGIRPRVFGGYALILGFLTVLALFAVVQVGRIAGTVGRLRSAGTSTEALGAAAGLDVGAIQIAIVNQSGPLRAIHAMRLAAIVDMARVAIMRYTATLLQGDADDARSTVINAQAV